MKFNEKAVTQPTDSIDTLLDVVAALWQGKYKDYKSPKECESCADAFISTHEGATNAVRNKVADEIFQKLESCMGNDTTNFRDGHIEYRTIPESTYQSLRAEYGGK